MAAAAAAVKAKAQAKATGAAEPVEDGGDEEFGHIDDDVKGILVVGASKAVHCAFLNVHVRGWAR